MKRKEPFNPQQRYCAISYQFVIDDENSDCVMMDKCDADLLREGGYLEFEGSIKGVIQETRKFLKFLKLFHQYRRKGGIGYLLIEEGE